MADLDMGNDGAQLNPFEEVNSVRNAGLIHWHHEVDIFADGIDGDNLLYGPYDIGSRPNLSIAVSSKNTFNMTTCNLQLRGLINPDEALSFSKVLTTYYTINPLTGTFQTNWFQSTLSEITKTPVAADKQIIQLANPLILPKYLVLRVLQDATASATTTIHFDIYGRP